MPNTEPSVIREWCIGQGLAKPGRGRLSAGCRDAYEAEHDPDVKVDRLGAPKGRKAPPRAPAPKTKTTRQLIAEAGPPSAEQLAREAEIKAKRLAPSPQSSGKLVAIPCTHGPDKTSLIPADLLVPPGSVVTWPTCKTADGKTMRQHSVPE